MKLTNRISLVGAGKWGGGLSHPLDCNIYTIDTGDGLIMVDSGCGLEPERLEENLRQDGYRMEDVRILVLTHYHADHACGASYVHDKSSCRVLLSEAEAPCVAQGDEIASSLAKSRGGAYPMDYIYHACPCAEGIPDGQILTLGDVSLKAVIIPGHSRADLSLYGLLDGKRCLFCGDSLFAGGEILLQSLYDVSLLPYREGMNRLAQLGADALFPGHGQFVLSDAQWHVERCSEGFNSGLVPRQFHYFA